MHTQPNPALIEAFSRDSTDPRVVVADGYGLTINVHHGHLVIADGIGRERRERRYSRAERKIRRLVILGHTGMITLDAIRWCADVGIAIHHVDNDGRVLTTSAPKNHEDARLRRAQALAAGTHTGLAVARYLLGVKLAGQATVADQLLNEPQIAEHVRADARELETADLSACLDIESRAANLYFSSWYPKVTVTFARRDQDKIPDHWRGFIARATPLHAAKTARNAADPINALLNYGYALLEAEALTACQAIGLDPGLGIVHTDKRERASLALDLMEAARPDIDRHILNLLQAQVFRINDFHETRDGRCRLLAPLTHEIAGNGPAWHAALAPHAEHVAHLIASSSDAPIKRRTPLTQANVRAAQRRGASPRVKHDSSASRVARRCVQCGAELANQIRKRCDTCAPEDLIRRGHQQIVKANRRMAELRAQGKDPGARPEVIARKRAALRRNRADLLKWQRDNPGVAPDPIVFAREIQPGLVKHTVRALHEATGLSISACSRIRAGTLTPHIRHWSALRAVSVTPLPERM